ncbi:hypothetical protein NMY22_g7442 [Coprinellus aureogranulatus]|nr:hypothetical protein NMY22_g7442 [Coprinellus aureogranulatus]
MPPQPTIDSAKLSNLESLESLLSTLKEENARLVEEVEALSHEIQGRSGSSLGGGSAKVNEEELDKLREENERLDEELKMAKKELETLQSHLDTVEQTLFDLQGEVAGGRHVPAFFPRSSSSSSSSLDASSILNDQGEVKKERVRVLGFAEQPDQKELDVRRETVERMGRENEALLERIALLERQLSSASASLNQSQNGDMGGGRGEGQMGVGEGRGGGQMGDKEDKGEEGWQKEKRLKRLQEVGLLSLYRLRRPSELDTRKHLGTRGAMFLRSGFGNEVMDAVLELSWNAMRSWGCLRVCSRMRLTGVVFASKSAEFREAIASILGLKLAFYPNGQVRVTSMYDLTASFVFQPNSSSGTFSVSSPVPLLPFPLISSSFANEIALLTELIRTGQDGMKMQLVAQSECNLQDLPNLMHYWIENEQCTPGFMASVTLECYESWKRAQEEAVVERMTENVEEQERARDGIQLLWERTSVPVVVDGPDIPGPQPQPNRASEGYTRYYSKVRPSLFALPGPFCSHFSSAAIAAAVQAVIAKPESSIQYGRYPQAPVPANLALCKTECVCLRDDSLIATTLGGQRRVMAAAFAVRYTGKKAVLAREVPSEFGLDDGSPKGFIPSGGHHIPGKHLTPRIRNLAPWPYIAFALIGTISVVVLGYVIYNCYRKTKPRHASGVALQRISLIRRRVTGNRSQNVHTYAWYKGQVLTALTENFFDTSPWRFTRCKVPGISRGPRIIRSATSWRKSQSYPPVRDSSTERLSYTIYADLRITRPARRGTSGLCRRSQ